MLKSAVFGSSFGSLFEHPSSSSPGRTGTRSGSVDVDVRGILRIDDERVRMRAAARLDGCDLLRFLDVADIEDADAAEPLRARRRFDALRAAVDAPARLLNRHEEQVAMNRDVALPSGTHRRRQQPRTLRAVDVVRVEAVEIADDHVVAAEREVGIREIQAAGPLLRLRRRRRRLSLAAVRRLVAGRPRRVAGAAATLAGQRLARRVLRIEEAARLRQARHAFHVLHGFAGIVNPGLQADARIVHVQRVRRDAGRRRRVRRRVLWLLGGGADTQEGRNGGTREKPGNN